MITVINDMDYSGINLYEGMSISDATTQMMLECNQIVNDMMMDILLTEHAYLYENGHEIQYVSEAGEATAESKSIKEKILGAIKAVKEKIMGAFNAAINWIQDKISEVIMFFKNKGVTEKSIDKLIEANGAATAEVNGWCQGRAVEAIQKSIDSKAWLHNAEVINADGSVDDAKLAKSSKDVFDDVTKSVSEASKDVQVAAALKTAKALIFGKDLIKSIKETQKKFAKELDYFLAGKKLAKDSDTDIAAFTASVNKVLKSNSYAASGYIKAYSKLVSENIKFIKYVAAAPAKEKIAAKKQAAKDAAANAKEDIKNAPHKLANRASAAVKSGKVKKEEESMVAGDSDRQNGFEIESADMGKFFR